MTELNGCTMKRMVFPAFRKTALKQSTTISQMSLIFFKTVHAQTALPHYRYKREGNKIFTVMDYLSVSHLSKQFFIVCYMEVNGCVYSRKFI